MGTGNRSSEFGGKEIYREVKCIGHADVKKGTVIKKGGMIKPRTPVS